MKHIKDFINFPKRLTHQNFYYVVNIKENKRVQRKQEESRGILFRDELGLNSEYLIIKYNN